MSNPNNSVSGLDEYGRARLLYHPTGRLVIVPGPRVQKHWDIFMSDQKHRTQTGFTDEQAEVFYQGWVKPLASMPSNYCGCRMPNFDNTKSRISMNISDIFDLAINTSAVPYLFPGSTNEVYGGSQDHHPMTCVARVPAGGKPHGTFTVEGFRGDNFGTAMRMLTEGDITVFSLSLATWFQRTKGVSERALYPIAISRIAKLVMSEPQPYGAFVPRLSFYEMPWNQNKDENGNTIKGRAERVADDLAQYFGNEEDALFTTLLMWTQSGHWIPGDFVPDTHDQSLLSDEGFLIRLLPLLRLARTNQRWDAFNKEVGGPYDLRLLMHAAENDIDLNLIDAIAS